MNLVVPLHPWNTNDMELRYALRGFAKYLPYDELHIIGHRPSWIKDCSVIPFRDDNQPKYRESNIYLKLQYYIDRVANGANFIFANDDHFLLKPFTYEVAHKGTLGKYYNSRNAQDPYRLTIRNTILKLGREALNFDVHYPLQIDPELFTKIFRGEDPTKPRVDWTKHYGYLIKSLYCNFFAHHTHKVGDLKINKADSADVMLGTIYHNTEGFFSTGDTIDPQVLQEVLEKLYPEPSRHE